MNPGAAVFCTISEGLKDWARELETSQWANSGSIEESHVSLAANRMRALATYMEILARQKAGLNFDEGCISKDWLRRWLDRTADMR